MMTRMISNLPEDLIEEILTRVPSNYMRGLRLICKKWNALSKNHSFRKMQLDREEATARELGENQMIVMMDEANIALVSAVVNENPYAILKGKLTCLNDSKQIKISQVFHCEDLLLCTLKYDNTKIVVWNSYLGQTRWIENLDYASKIERDTSVIRRKDRHVYALGYENNKSCRSYKIFTFIYDYDFPGKPFLFCGIYNFDSDLWRDLDVTPQWRIPFHDDHGVSLKGNTYWFAPKMYSREIINMICFDFTKERFGPLLPLLFCVWEYNCTLSCVREEKLAALYVDTDTYTIEIWITTKIDAENVSWSKFLEAPSCYQSFTGSFFINEGKKFTMLLREGTWVDEVEVFGEDGYLDLGEPSEEFCWPYVCSYVPSLAQIKQPDIQIRPREKVSVRLSSPKEKQMQNDVVTPSGSNALCNDGEGRQAEPLTLQARTRNVIPTQRSMIPTQNRFSILSDQ